MTTLFAYFLRSQLQVTAGTCRLALAILLAIGLWPCVMRGDDWRGPGVIRGKTVDKEGEPQAPDTETEMGLPYSRIFRDSEKPYEDLIRDYRISGEINPDLGESGLRFNAEFFRGIRLESPLLRGPRPEDAELKLGDFYLDIETVSGRVLLSDNVDQSEIDRDFGVISSLQMNLGVSYQLGDNLRIGARGGIVYLPQKGEVGLTGFGLGFGYAALGRFQIAYDIYASEWEITLLDDFRVRQLPSSGDETFGYFEGFTFDEEDRAGRYRARATLTRTEVGSRRDPDLGSLSDNLIEFRNAIGATAGRMLPTVTRLQAGAFHEDYWYQNERVGQKLPKTRDYGYMSLVSQRESFRFKPFVLYRASKYDYQDDWDHKVRGGIQGPITDYIYFFGDVGYYWNNDSGRNAMLWRVALEHNPTENIFHRLQYFREITEPDHDLEETWSYRIRYEINEDLRAELFGIRSVFEDLDNTNTGGNEWDAGIRFTYRVAEHILFHIGGVYSRVENDNPVFPDVKIWTARAEFHYQHTRTLESRLVYQHQIRESNLPLDSYRENFVSYSLTKYF